MRKALAPFDYYFYRPELYTLRFLFEYPRRLDPDLLQRALNRCLHILPKLGAVLRPEGAHGLAFSYGELHEIPLFYECRAPSAASSDESHESFFSSQRNDFGVPLLNVKVTELGPRTLVGVGFSHLLGDGFSFGLFLKSLAEEIQAIKNSADPIITPAPVMPGLVDEVPASAMESIEAATGDFFSETAYSLEARYQRSLHGEVREERFAKTTLAEIREDLLRDRGRNFSAHEILMAMVLKRSDPAALRVGELSVARCPVDVRRKIFRRDQIFFGNAVKDALVIFENGELANLSLSDIALRVRESVRAVDADSFARLSTGMKKLLRDQGPEVFASVTCPGLVVSNLTQLPFSQLDLGVGPPTRALAPAPWPGLAVLLDDGDAFKIVTGH